MTIAPPIQDDMFTPEAIAHPYEYYGRLREEDPVHWNKLYDLWVITRHDDVVWMTRHNELFSNMMFQKDPRPPYPPIDESDNELYEYVRDFQSQMIVNHDDPEHKEMRQVVHSYFKSRSMEAWRPFVKEAIKQLLDEAEAKGSMDVLRDLATPLPVLVIAQMIGVPYEERLHVRELAEKLLARDGADKDRMRVVTEGMRDMIDYVSPMVDERIVNPGEDLISVLAQGEKRGVFTRHQVLVNTCLLFLAGHETTINLLCNGTLAFLQHPDQWELFKQDPQGRATMATEECLRYDAPVKSIQRLAAEDIEMRGKMLRKYDRIRWFISSANRDPRKFANPDTFDISRDGNQHVSFGTGVHTCLGAAVARIEGQEAFLALAQRFPNLHTVTHTLEYQPSITFRSVKSLPVAWN